MPNQALITTIDETIAAKGTTNFLGLVARFATSCEDIIQGLRLETHKDSPIDFANYICPDLLQDLFPVVNPITEFDVLDEKKEAIKKEEKEKKLQLFTDVLSGYLNQVPNDLDIVGFYQRSYDKEQALRDQDPIARNTSLYDFQVNAWKSKLYTDKKLAIDKAIAGLETRLESIIHLEGQNTIETVSSSFSAEAFPLLFGEGMQVNGDLRRSLIGLRKKMYQAAAFEYKEDPELLYRLSFNACTKAKGWQELEDKQLYEALESENVSAAVFEKWTGRKINYQPKQEPDNKPRTVAEVIREQAANPPQRNIKLQYELMLEATSYANGVGAFRDSYKDKEAEVPQQLLYDNNGKTIIRPLTFRENLLARVEDFETLNNSDGTERTLDQRLRLFKKWLDSCTGIAYSAEQTDSNQTDDFRIIPVCKELITISSSFNQEFISINYATLQEGTPLKRSQAKYNLGLTQSEVLEHQGWLVAVEEDKTLLQAYSTIVFSNMVQSNGNAMGFYLRNDIGRNQLRALFVDYGFSSNAVGYDVLNDRASFLRVAPPSSKNF